MQALNNVRMLLENLGGVDGATWACLAEALKRPSVGLGVLQRPLVAGRAGLSRVASTYWRSFRDMTDAVAARLMTD